VGSNPTTQQLIKLNQMITYFKSINYEHVSVPFLKDIDTAIDRIREGNSKDIIEQVREEKDKTARNLLKKKLPAICFSGEFSKREDSAISSHSGFICLDFDGFIDEWDMGVVRERMVKDPYSYSVFTSPSGDGIKVIVKIPPIIENHKNYFLSLEKYYDLHEFDKSCKNISRVCYESYDPDIYINKDSDLWDKVLVEDYQVFDKATSRTTIKLDDNNEVVRRLLVWWNANFGLMDGSRNNNTFVLMSAFNEYGISKEEARSIAHGFSSESFPVNEIDTTVESAYKNIAAHGTKFYEDTKEIDSINESIRNGVPIEDVVRAHNKAPEDVVKAVIESVKSNDAESFWVKSSKGVVKHINHKYKEFLESLGYFKYYPANSNNFVFVKVENNVISDVVDDMIKDVVLDYLYALPDLSIFNYFSDKTKLFKEDHLSFISRIDPRFMKDTVDTAYLYYRNCAVKITKDGYSTIDYMDIDGYVWTKQKIDRDFTMADNKKAVFRKFVQNIGGHSVDRIQSLESTIGFLLHAYKPASYCPAVILNDEVISDNPEGGTGKGMLMNAISHFQPTVILDGKMFSFSASFPYQSVSASTNVLVYDDVPRNYDFEKIFSIVTEGITLEKKNKDSIKIPFADSPKIAITTNYAIKGAGNSFERRKWELELAQHYGGSHTPEKEFGHMFFTGWDAKEWSLFDNYMISNIQLYLEKGLCKSDFTNLAERKFIIETSYDFYEWMKDPDNKMSKVGTETPKNILHAAFTNDNPDYSNRGKYPCTMIKFGRWLDLFGEYMYSQPPTIKRNSLGKIIKFERKSDQQIKIDV
jgi:hypothetical protein